MISVIVPIYKVEQYLNRCIQSITGQSYESLEIILVDDGSPDNCPAMCDEWATKDQRIKVIHKQNGGLSDARNAGVLAASGEYIAFVDSDDWIAPEMMEKLLQRMTETDSDIVSCDAVRVWDDDTPCRTMIRVNGDYVLDQIDAMKALIQSTHLVQTVWNKLYKSSLVRKVPFEKGKIHEDEYWSWQVISLASRVSTIKEALYYYYQRSDSIIGSGYTGQPLLIVEAKCQRHAFIVSKMPELNDIDTYNLLKTCFYQGVLVQRYESGIRRKLIMTELKKTLRMCKFSKGYLSQRKWTERRKLFFIKHFLRAACYLARVRGVA